ncbi:MAG: VWA domain-containing protein [Verrucomicrobiae bacterium]|nr:VWA domain-containing protein [Verrucomicrobiae bacterium]
MRFAEPQLLWLLLLVPAALWLFWHLGRRRQALLERFIHARLLPGLTEGFSPARRRGRQALLLAALALLIVAAARPQWGYHWEEVKRRGVDILLAVDTSRSMLAEDIKPNRLERAKLAALDLAQTARSDRVGLIAFAGSAFLQCPLTMDTEAFRQSVMMLDTEIIPQGGTAIAEAIEVAQAAFTNAGESHKVLVVFSDGEDHEAGVLEAAAAAARAGIKIFTIGIGTPEGEELRVPEPGGRRETARDAEGRPVRTRLEERLLHEVATTGGGFYLRLAGAGTMALLYEKGIAPLPKAEQAARMVRVYHERYHWPLGLAILLLLAEILVGDCPMRERWTWRRARRVVWGLAGLALLWAGGPAQAVSPAEARRELDRGYHKAAKKAYEELLLKRPEDNRLRYNLGVAAFRDRDYERAAREFEAAAMTPENLDLQQRAFYNAASARYHLGQAEPELEKKKAAWQTATNHLAHALRLNPQDADAQHNLEVIRRKLEELEQLQQQQQQQQQQSSSNSQDSQGENSPNPSQQSQAQNEQQGGQNARQPEQNPAPQAQPQPTPDQQQQQQQGDRSPAEAQDAAGNKNPPPEGQGQADPSRAVKVMGLTPEQARQLLEAAKVEEKMLPYIPPEAADARKRSNRTFKNW